MGFVGSLFSDDNGSGFHATPAQINNPTNANQISTAYDQTQTGLQQQQAFIDALKAQNGIQNQSNALGQQSALQQQLAGQNGVANQSQALSAQQQLAQALAGQGGVGNQSSVFAQQQGLAGQFQDLANGTGPNPAQAQLAQATAANTANQAALMASQRGASANVGLIGRQAAMQGANTQQQAAGQAATLGAQQQIAGMQGLAQQQQALGQTAQAQIANQAAQQGAVAGLSSQQIAQQQAANNALAAQATQQVGQQGTATQGYNQAAQGQQQNLLGAQANYNHEQVLNQSNVNNANAGIAQGNQKFQADTVGGVVQGAGTAAMMLAEGGEVPSLGVSTALAPAAYGSDYAGNSNIGRFLNTPSAPLVSASSTEGAAPMNPNASEASKGGQMLGKGLVTGGSKLFSGSGAPMMPSGSTGVNAPAFGASAPGGAGALAAPGLGVPFAKGGPVDGEKLAKDKKTVPGKAKVKGNSYANDTVKAVLSPGEVVLPLSVMQSANPAQEAARFVQAVLAKKQGMKR